jgi:hypothetical protein
VGVQEVRWDNGGKKPAGEYIFFYTKRNENHELGRDIFVHKSKGGRVQTSPLVREGATK